MSDENFEINFSLEIIVFIWLLSSQRQVMRSALVVAICFDRGGIISRSWTRKEIVGKIKTVFILTACNLFYLYRKGFGTISAAGGRGWGGGGGGRISFHCYSIQEDIKVTAHGLY